jgi:hypothetical protein
MHWAEQRVCFPRSIQDAMTPRIGGLPDTSLSSNELLVQSDILSYRGGASIVAPRLAAAGWLCPTADRTLKERRFSVE